MRRDMDLVRKIFVEVHSWGQTDFRTIQIEGYDSAQVQWQIAQMIDAGLLDGLVKRSQRGDGAIDTAVRGINWEGSELADVILNDSLWAQLKEKLSDGIATTPFEVIKKVGIELSTALARKLLGL